MALIKCPECGREISDKAPQCPHCGCPIASSRPNTVEATIQPKLSTKIRNLKIAKIFVFDNCDVEVVNNAFRITAEKLGQELFDWSSSDEPSLVIEWGKTKKCISLMCYESTKFKTKRIIASITCNAKIEDGTNDLKVSPLSDVVDSFRDVIKEANSTVVLFEESDYIDITKSFKQAAYQHIFDKEKELQEKDNSNLRTAEEEAEYKNSIGFDFSKEDKIRGVAQRRIEEREKRIAEKTKARKQQQNAPLLVWIGFISIPVFLIGLLIDNDTMFYGGIIVILFVFLYYTFKLLKYGHY